ncbi:hypothetical protein C8A00DRAFT_36610 [Chaetomidium leptoderma]|uniref:Uncharacterized protein n=1 Tax=Chaetomidium leptoderma TaxID=669021 RepID=A0AAN6VFZ9_9PEZI|nr:hypothetical protein C8A00DRAFT_36610 [Chaetomidium leptoderma]
MAGDDSTAAEPRPGESGQEQEKFQAENESSQRQTERGTQQESEEPSPPLPPRPVPVLPPSHQEMLKSQPAPPLHQGVHFGPLPVEDPDYPFDVERPHYPRWHMTKLALFALSYVICVVIFGVCIALGFFNAPYSTPYFGEPVEYEFGTSATAAGLAVLVTTIELLRTWLSTRRQGMHPGSLVAFHLIIWLLALVAVVVTTLFATNSADYGDYDYPRADRIVLRSQSQVYEQILLGFDCVLLAIHFVLFVGACVETNRLQRAKRKVVVVRVPVQVGAPYPGGQYYGPPQSFVPQPGAQPGQYPFQMMAQVPPAAAAYGGYYAPAPQQMNWATSQQQSMPGMMQGGYVPAATPALSSSNPARHSGREQSAPALASSSGSRRSQRLAQAQATTQPTTDSQEPAKPEEPVSERTT